MPTRFLPAAVALGLACCLTNAGCSGKKALLDPVTVKGRLVPPAGTKSLPPVVLTFHPQDEGNQDTAPSCATNADGNFTVKGRPGTYKVTIAPIRRQGESDPATGGAAAPGTAGGSRVPGVPATYGAAETTRLEATFPESGSDELVLQLTNP